MIWALIAVLAVVILGMALYGREQVPWGRKLQRLYAGVAYKAEWMAPDEVIHQVCTDYLAARNWLQDGLLTESSQRLASASLYLADEYLGRYLSSYQQFYAGHAPRFVGVMHTDHQVQVRHFSEDGTRCLIVDRQMSRTMTTYDRKTNRRLQRQDLGESAVVYSMIYDNQFRRWKIASFVQELPIEWLNQPPSRHIRLLSTLPITPGRDN